MRAESLEELRVFVRIVESGSIRAAAAALNMSVHTASRRLARLEERLGVSLALRTTRSLGVTTPGRRYYARCLAILAAVEDAEAELYETQALAGTLRVSIPTLASELLLPQLVALAEENPELELQLLVNDETPNVIAEGLDAAVFIGEVASSWVALRIFEIEGVLAASPAYVARRGAPQTIGELADHACLRFLGPHAETEWVLRDETGRETVAPVSGHFSASSSRALMDACRVGVGVGLVPRRLAEPLFEAGALVPILPGYRTRPFPLRMAFPSSARRAPKTRRLLEALRSPSG